MANMQWADRIGRRLKLRDLHVLFAVIQSGSMAKAARHLAVSQPVVSAAIAGLEQTLGVRLLDRSRRGVEPTIYGRALLNHGLAAFDALRQGVKEIEFLADGSRWMIRSKDGVYGLTAAMATVDEAWKVSASIILSTRRLAPVRKSSKSLAARLKR